MANRRFIDFPIASSVGDSDIILIWQSGVNKQTTKATFLSGLPENLDELNDVAISGLTNGQILRYDSVTGKWENTDQGNLDLNDLNDVSIVSPSNGQVLVYNSSTSKWENSSGGFVPYVGAVTTVDLGAQGLRAGYVRFDTSVVTVPDEQGLMYWDASRSTAALIMNGTLQHIGQDTFFYVKNSTGSNIAKGTAVRFDGTDGASGHLKIAPFLANGTYPSTYFMGVTAEAISNGSFGQVMHFGELTGINTSGYTAGALLYASTTVAGGFQTTVPVAPNNIVLVAAAVNSKNNGAIVVRPTYGSNINTDEGVKITSPTTGDLLQLQAGGLWENKTKAQILGGTASQFVKGNGSLDSTSYQPLLTNPVTGTGAAGRVAYWNGSGTITSDSLFQWNDFSKRLGIGRTPTVSLDVEGAGFFSGTVTASSIIKSGGTSSQYLMADGSVSTLTNPVTGTGTTNYLPKFTGSTTIGNSQVFDNGSGVTINGTNVGERFNVNGYIGLQRSASQIWHYGVDSTNSLEFVRSGIATRIILSSDGNLGLGVTPSAWFSTWRAIEIGGADSNLAGNGTGPLRVIRNAFIDSGGNWIYKNTGEASFYQQNSGNHVWFSAASGTAGNGITFNPLMSLFSSGNLLIGTVSDNGARLQVSGAATVGGQITILGNAIGTSTFLEYKNNGSAFGYVGSAAAIVSGGAAGNLAIGTNADLVFASGASYTPRLTIASTGAATFSSSVTATTATLSGSASDRLIMTRTSVGTYHLAISATNRFAIYDPAADAERISITSSGNVLIGTTTDSGNDRRLQVAGNLFVDDNSTTGNGVQLKNADRPLITRGWDAFTSGNKTGVGRWGVYMESAELFLGSPGTDYNTGLVTIGGWLADGTKQPNLTVNNYTRNVLIGSTTDNGSKLQVNGAIRTAQPVGTTSNGWLLGRALVSGTSTPNRWIRVQIGLEYYDILAVYMGTL